MKKKLLLIANISLYPGITEILSDNRVSNFYICNGVANTKIKREWQRETSRFCRLGGLWSFANAALERCYGRFGQPDR